MIAASHIAVGAAIGAKTNSFFWGGLLSLISHFILDRFPHFDIGFSIKRNKFKLKPIHMIVGLFDFFTSFFVIFILFGKFSNFHFIFFGAAMAILPDIIDVTRYFFKLPFLYWYFNLHNRIQGSEDKISGTIFQILIIVLSLFITFY